MSNIEHAYFQLPDGRVFPLARGKIFSAGGAGGGYIRLSANNAWDGSESILGIYTPSCGAFDPDTYTGSPYDITWTNQDLGATIRPLTGTSGTQWIIYVAGSAYISEITASFAGTPAHWPWQAGWNNPNLVCTVDTAGETSSRWVQIKGSDKIYVAGKWRQVGDDVKTDYSGKEYPVCRVGVGEIGQVWTCRNLDDTTYGIYYNNSETNGAIYGTLHTQPQAVSIWESCQGDYRPARLDEWKTLISLAGGATYGAINLKAVDGWSSAQGVDYFGFSALPGGGRISSGFSGIGSNARFSTVDATSTAINYIAIQPGKTGNLFYASTSTNMAGAYSVRMVANTGRATISGIEYPVCQVGGLWWQAENDKSESFSTARDDSALNELYGPLRTFEQMQNYDNELKAAGSTWRVPRYDELYNYFTVTLGNTAALIRATEGWADSDVANNLANFNALPGGNSSSTVGKSFICGTITEVEDTKYRMLWQASGSLYLPFYSYAKSTLTSTRLVKRFYRVPMPWGEVRTFVHIGGLYIDTQNLDWAGKDENLGTFYNNDQTLGTVYGRLYTKAEHDTILAYLAERKIPVSTLDSTQFSTLTTYNSGNASTQAVNLCDPELFAGATNLYELSLLPNGLFTGSGYAELGATCYLMSRAGILSFDATGLCSVAEASPSGQYAAIRLCYAAPESAI